MCTITLFYKVIDKFPVLIAQNRDSLERNLEIPPKEIQSIQKVFAPIDMNSGGTWIGVNQNKVVLALTNYYQPEREKYIFSMSRGSLVLEALKKCDSSEQVILFVENAVKHQKLKFFNLFSLSPDRAFFIQYNGAFQVNTISEGLHFHYSSGYDEGYIKNIRETRLKHLFSEFNSHNLDDALENIWVACRDHSDTIPSEQSICMHGKQRRTVSSTILAVPYFDRNIYCYYLYGSPCEKKYTGFLFTI